MHWRGMWHFGRTAKLLDRWQSILEIQQTTLDMSPPRIGMCGCRRHGAATAAATAAGWGCGGRIAQHVQRLAWHSTRAPTRTATVMRMMHTIVTWRQRTDAGRGTRRGTRGRDHLMLLLMMMMMLMCVRRGRCQVIGTGSWCCDRCGRGWRAGATARYGRRLGVVRVARERRTRRACRAHRVQAVRLRDTTVSPAWRSIMMPTTDLSVECGLMECMMMLTVRIVHWVGAGRGNDTPSVHARRGPAFGTHGVAAGRLLYAPAARRWCQSVDTRSANHTAQRQQTLGHSTLNGLHKAASADDPMTTRWGLHGGPCIDADDTLILLRCRRIRFALLLQLAQQLVLQTNNGK